jgi:membrane protein DedA with SNARE-associated domain
VEHFLETWSYLAVFVLSFISSMGLPVGAELAIIGGGVLASGECVTTAVNCHPAHPVNFVLVIIVAVAGEVLGSLAGYGIGRYGGRALVDKVGKYVLLTHKDLDRAEAWFARRGEPVVLFGRFIPLLRSFVSFAAGLGEMTLGKFTLYTVIGCAVWCTALVSLGYSLGSSYHHVLKAFSYAGYVLAAVAVVAVVVVFWHRYRQYRAERDAQKATTEV